MDKIWLIIKREYLVRIRKKSFIVMTLLGTIADVTCHVFTNISNKPNSN